jgi:hypothetical protein
METAGDRRRRKLAALCEEHGRDNVARLSGTNPFTLDQVIKGVRLPPKKDGTRGVRNLGHAAARAIEEAFQLPIGWFDQPDEPAGTPSSAALAVGETYDKMTRAQQELFLKLLEASFGAPVLARPRELGHSDFMDIELEIGEEDGERKNEQR